MSKLKMFLLLLLPFALFNSVKAADFRNYKREFLILEGPIVPGDYEKFIKEIKDGQGVISTIFLFTPGGDFEEAMKIGQAIRALKLGTSAPSRDDKGNPDCSILIGDGSVVVDPANCTCASAGFMIYIAGTSRGGLYLLVHRPYFDKKLFGQLPEDVAQKKFDSLQKLAAKYMQDMGVPNQIQEEVLGTPSEDGLLLDEQTIRRYFLGDLPAYHEWIESKCNVLTDDERAQLDAYSNKMTAPGFQQSDLSDDDWASVGKLQKKEDEERNCALEQKKNDRLAAYQNFFEATPEDFASQDFKIWTNAWTYLGRSFDDVSSEGNFKEVDGSITGVKPEYSIYLLSLNRDETPTNPGMQLYDDQWNKRVVQKVNLLKTNPSDEFIRILKAKLTKKWGKSRFSGVKPFSKGDKELGFWVSKKDELEAKLTYSSISADGPYLTFEIDHVSKEFIHDP